jgi:DNA-directed RNA polymerase specialized sigma24 family protein
LSEYEQDRRPWPEEQAVLSEQQAELQQQLQSLPEEQQELIALKFGAG